MNLKRLKIGQKVHIHLFSKIKEATVTEMTKEHVRMITPLSGGENSWILDFNYDGSQICSWYGSGGYDPRPIADLKIIIEKGRWTPTRT
jgi:hypothetical protein